MFVQKNLRHPVYNVLKNEIIENIRNIIRAQQSLGQELRKKKMKKNRKKVREVLISVF